MVVAMIAPISMYTMSMIYSFLSILIGWYPSMMEISALSVLIMYSSASGSASGNPPPRIPICFIGSFLSLLRIGCSSKIVMMSCACVWLKSAFALAMWYLRVEFIARYRQMLRVLSAWRGSMSDSLVLLWGRCHRSVSLSMPSNCSNCASSMLPVVVHLVGMVSS